MNNKRCNHSMCLMSKVGFDYRCNKCGGIVLDMTEGNFEDTPDADLINDLRAELDEEARMENEEMSFGDSQLQNEELEGNI